MSLRSLRNHCSAISYESNSMVSKIAYGERLAKLNFQSKFLLLVMPVPINNVPPNIHHYAMYYACLLMTFSNK